MWIKVNGTSYNCQFPVIDIVSGMSNFVRNNVPALQFHTENEKKNVFLVTFFKFENVRLRQRFEYSVSTTFIF